MFLRPFVFGWFSQFDVGQLVLWRIVPLSFNQLLQFGSGSLNVGLPVLVLMGFLAPLALFFSGTFLITSPIASTCWLYQIGCAPQLCEVLKTTER